MDLIRQVEIETEKDMKEGYLYEQTTSVTG